MSIFACGKIFEGFTNAQGWIVESSLLGHLIEQRVWNFLAERSVLD